MTPVNYSAKLDIDFSNLKSALHQTIVNLKDAKATVKMVNAENKSYTDGLKALEEQLKANVDREEALRLKLIEVQKSETSNAEAKLKATTTLKIQQAETEKARKALIEYNGTTDESKRCNNEFCKSLSFLELALYDIAKALTQKACKALVDFTKETLNTGMQFESSFAGVKKVTNGTKEDFEKLEKQIRQTALEKPISASQLASIYQMGSQLGIAKNDLKDFSDTIIDLAKTSNLTEEAGATLIAQYANVTKLPAEDYRKFASTLSYLGSTTATTESTIMDFASRISGSATLIGMTHQEILALSAAMGSVGINAEMGGSAISKIMNNIDVAVDKNNETLKVWADTAGMSAVQFINLWKNDVASAFQAVISGMSSFKDEGGSLNLLLEELDIKNIRQTETLKKLANASKLLTEDMQKANEEWVKASFLSESASNVYNTVESQIQSLKNSFEEMQISIYEGFKEPLAECVKELNNYLKSEDAKRFVDEVSKAFKKIGELAVYWVKAIIKNVDKVVAVIKTAVSVIVGLFANKFATAVTKGAFALQGLINHIISLPTKLAAATSATEMFNIVLGTNPAGAIATALGLLISAIVMFALNADKATDVTKENTKALESQRDQLIANREEREKTIAGIESESNYTQGLVNELKTLVDENGKVKDGYQDRVNQIVPLIQKATGEEIQLIDGQIVKYNELIGTLDNVIAKKRLEAKINAYQGDYEEAIKAEEKAKNDDIKCTSELIKKEDELKRRLEFQQKEIAAGRGMNLGGYAQETTRLQNEIKELQKRKDLIDSNAKDRQEIIDKYEGLIKEQYNSFTNKANTTGNNTVSGFTGSYGKNVVNAATATSKKVKEESKTTYQELLTQEKAYGDQLKNYLEEVKKGNSQVTVEMVQDTKKKLEETQKKVKEMKELLGDNTVTSKLVLNDETYGGLTQKRQELKDQLSQLQTELANGNQSITQDMLNNVGKQIGQVEAKIKNLKNEWDESDADGEISDEFESENTNHVSKGVIFGKGVLGDNAVEIEGAGKDAAGKYLDAFLKEKEDKKNQIAINAIEQANVEATNYQLATTDPNNLAIYDTTERLLAESKQTSQAQGLVDNAYKVVDAETWTLNQAIEAAKQIDYKQIGRFMCVGIANGISENAHLVVSAVRTMMAEANAAAKDEEKIKSPSKVFYRFGKYMDLGLANGIRDYASEVSTQVRQMTSRANEAISLANNQMKSERLGNQQTLNGSGPTEINYNFVQNNTSNKSLDTLAIYQESKSMLKRAVRNQYV